MAGPKKTDNRQPHEIDHEERVQWILDDIISSGGLEFDGGEVSMTAIARRRGMARRTVKQIMVELTSKGTIDHLNKHATGMTPIYRLADWKERREQEPVVA